MQGFLCAQHLLLRDRARGMQSLEGQTYSRQGWRGEGLSFPVLRPPRTWPYFEMAYRDEFERKEGRKETDMLWKAREQMEQTLNWGSCKVRPTKDQQEGEVCGMIFSYSPAS